MISTSLIKDNKEIGEEILKQITLKDLNRKLFSFL